MMKMTDLAKEMEEVMTVGPEKAECFRKMNLRSEIVKLAGYYSVILNPEEVGEQIMRSGMYMMGCCGMDSNRMLKIINNGIEELIEE
jgi:hypothetical protein